MKRVGKRVLHEMKAFMIRKKRGRFASYVGSLCRKNQAFARWMQVILYKMEDQEVSDKNTPIGRVDVILLYLIHAWVDDATNIEGGNKDGRRNGGNKGF